MLNQFRSFAREKVISAGASFGLTIVPSWRANRRPMATHLSRLFTLLDVDCVLDVEANLGQYRDFLRDEVRYSGRIVSFKPIPEHAAAMRQRATGDASWEVHGIALGAQPGTASFNIMAGTEFSSFLRPTDKEVNIFQGANEVERSIEVELSTVDAMLPQLRGAGAMQSVYLKMDTQGFDLDVLRGAAASLNKIPALQTEASVRQIYDGAPHFSEAIQTIEALNFSLSGIFPNNDGHFPLLVEIDCVFVANRHRHRS